MRALKSRLLASTGGREPESRPKRLSQAKAAGVTALPILVLGETGGALEPGSPAQCPDTLMTTLWTFDKLAIAARTAKTRVSCCAAHTLIAVRLVSE